MAIIDGKKTAEALRETIRIETEKRVHQYGITPHLCVILVGNNPASESYVRGKEKACLKAGIQSTVLRLPETIDQASLRRIVQELNDDVSVHGILLQLPIPAHLDSEELIQLISPKKDVDGFTPTSVATLANGQPGLVPCTPKGVIQLLETYDIPIQGKECVVVGRSQIVGKPVANLLLQRNGTVTICHSKTKDLPQVCARADILVVAIGRPKMVDDRYVKDGAVVIDVGISKVDGVIQGDVDFDKVAPKASWITPVPGGVGPMTIACLLENTLICYDKLVGVSS